MTKRKKLSFSASKTIQHDTLSISQLLNQYNANPSLAQEGYLDDDIANIGKFHRRFVDFTDLAELKEHVKKLSTDINHKWKELEEEEKKAREQVVNAGEISDNDNSAGEE